MSHCWQKWQTRQRCRRAPAPLEHACAAGRGDWLSLSGGGREGFLFAFTDPTRPGTSRRFGPQGIKNNTRKDSEDKEGAPGGMTRRGKLAQSEHWAAIAAPPTRNRNWLRAPPVPATTAAAEIRPAPRPGSVSSRAVNLLARSGRSGNLT